VRRDNEAARQDNQAARQDNEIRQIDKNTHSETRQRQLKTATEDSEAIAYEATRQDSETPR